MPSDCTGAVVAHTAGEESESIVPGKGGRGEDKSEDIAGRLEVWLPAKPVVPEDEKREAKEVDMDDECSEDEDGEEEDEKGNADPTEGKEGKAPSYLS